MTKKINKLAESLMSISGDELQELLDIMAEENLLQLCSLNSMCAIRITEYIDSLGESHLEH